MTSLAARAGQAPDSPALTADAAQALLLAGLLARFAALDLPALSLKGLVASGHDLRRPRTSADLDLIVAPSRFEQATQHLQAWGFTQQDSDTIWSRASGHSITLVSEAWPLAIDLHFEYPGMNADPEATFWALWDRREVMSFAGIDVAVMDKASTCLVMLLHDLRNPADLANAADSIDDVLNRLAPGGDDAQLAKLAQVAHSTGSATALRHVNHPWITAALDAQGFGEDADSSWSLIVASQGQFWAMGLRHLDQLKGTERLREALRLLWPSSSDIAAGAPEHATSASRRLGFRLSRLRRFSLQLARHLNRKLRKRDEGQA